MHQVNAFITLTYDDAHYTPSLNYNDFRLFMRRVRKQHGPTRFFAAGEYGETTLRPHWHALLFGLTFQGTPVGHQIYRSPELEKLWPYGFSSYGEVTLASAAYVAAYTTTSKQKNYTRIDPDTGEYFTVTPEMGRMSLKPGIGATWIKKY